MTRQIEVVIIGGGQAGLAMSYYLTQQRRKHVVLERGRVAETWRSQRWDSFTLVTPNWMTGLPGFPYQGDDPDGFLPGNAIVTTLEQYALSFQAPLRCGVQATAVRPRPEGNGGYLVETSEGTFEATLVVLATGGFPRPRLPQASAALPVNIMQLHSSQYRKPQRLPSGAVLVVGSGQSGSQIAEELHQRGRQVYLSVSRCGRSPRRYRGKDVMWWVNQMGGYDRSVDQLSSPAARFACHPDLTGKDGGHEINLRHLAREGVVLLGRLQDIHRNHVIIAPDLEENLNKADTLATQLTRAIDDYVRRTGMDVPAESMTAYPMSIWMPPAEPIEDVDLYAAGISTVIWATGFQLDFSWVHVPVFDETGAPVHRRGITSAPGLYFLGLPWLYKEKSALLFGIGEDAAFLAAAIAASDPPVQ
ncbi:MAG TPA: NAD(P)-binding domain-containing protein [Ktedonobacteraceae bacterium]